MCFPLKVSERRRDGDRKRYGEIEKQRKRNGDRERERERETEKEEERKRERGCVRCALDKWR